MKNDSSQLKWGSFLNYGQMALGILIGLIYTPFMIKTLGQSEYGLYNTVSSAVGMFSVLNFGFSAGYIRYYSKYKADGESEKIYRLNGLFTIIFAIIAAVTLSGGLLLSFDLDLVFKSGLTPQEYPTAKILMIIMSVNMSASFLISVINSIITANERFVFLKTVSLITTVLSPVINVPLLLLGMRSIGLVLAAVFLALSADIIKCIYAFKVLKVKFIFSNFEKGLFKSLFAYSFFIGVNIIIDQINWNIDKLLLARFKGTSAVAVYSVGYALYGHYMLFSTSISGVFTPRIHKIVNETKHDAAARDSRLSSLFTRVGRIQFMVLSLIAGGVVFFGKPFILNFWAGEGYEASYAVALLLILPASVALIQNIGIEIQRAENLHRFRSVTYLIMALINLGISIVLCRKYGAVGCAAGTAISLIVANGVIMNIYYFKRCGIDIPAFWFSIAKLSKGLIPPVTAGILIVKFVDLDSPLAFVLSVVAYCAIHCTSQWLIGMNDSEKDLIRLPIKKKVKKI